MDLHARSSPAPDIVAAPSTRNSAAVLRVGVLGLGYVGLPLAVTLARHFSAVGYDIDSARIAELRRGHDRTGELTADRLRSINLDYCDDSAGFAGLDIYIVTAPTPVDGANRPDLGPLLAASETVGRMIDGSKRPIIVFESTVWPGVTEDVCGPAIERASGLKRGIDFFLGYSPERINPGDR